MDYIMLTQLQVPDFSLIKSILKWINFIAQYKLCLFIKQEAIHQVLF